MDASVESVEGHHGSILFKLGRFLPTTFAYFIFTCCSYMSQGTPVELWVVAIAKILPILTLINFILAHHDENMAKVFENAYSRFIFLGLCFSMLGDVILVYQNHSDACFAAGMAFFLIGHLMYICAFSWTPVRFQPMLLVKFIVIALLLYRYMWNGKLSSAPITIQIGVFAYSITIALMNWTSWTRLFYRGFMEGEWHTLMGCLGAAFFLISDTILGINKFRGPIPHENYLIMGSYYLAQFGIVVSIESVPKQRKIK